MTLMIGKDIMGRAFQRPSSIIWPASAPSRQSGIGGVKGHNINEISFPGSPALWAGSFTSSQWVIECSGISLKEFL